MTALCFLNRPLYRSLTCISAVSLILPLIALSQSARVTTEQVIDGATPPELIPDSFAYRMVLISLRLPSNPTRVDLVKQKARFDRLKLASADLPQLARVINDFSAAYAKWQVQSQSEDVSAAGSDKDRLIADTLSLIQQSLSAEGVEKFKGYVQGEKS